MAPTSNKCTRKEVNRGAWTAEEDQKLAQVIEIHGPKRWKSVAAKAGLKRCGKSCRLRWMNYLRPNIKRGNISDQEEDLILRLHKLLGNRWSLIAGRLPGRTDNEIKNYWNSHLSKKIKQNEKQNRGSRMQQSVLESSKVSPVDFAVNGNEQGTSKTDIDDQSTCCIIGDETLFDFYNSNEPVDNKEWMMSQFLELDHEPLNLEWMMSQSLEMDESWFN